MNAQQVSVVIATYRRQKYVVKTISALLEQHLPVGEIVIVDQTESDDKEFSEDIRSWEREKQIRYIKLDYPSIPVAMNRGLKEAKYPIVLFLDDDIEMGNDLVQAHASNYTDSGVCGVVGQILQPSQVAFDDPINQGKGGVWKDLEFPFNSNRRAYIHNCMAGNLSIRRDAGIKSGGFDENFMGVAYRFETEFCRRLIRTSGGKMVFDPRASIYHIAAASGGTRSFGNPLKSASPAHSVGDYYFGFQEGVGSERWVYAARRFRDALGRRFYIRNPWWIPAKIVGEVRGMMWALRLSHCGPRFCFDSRK